MALLPPLVAPQLLAPALAPVPFFGVAHGIPYAYGGDLPPGVWFLLDFAENDIEGKNLAKACNVLCTARPDEGRSSVVTASLRSVRYTTSRQ